MRKKEILSTIGRVLLLIVAFMVGATNGVAMAEAIPLDGGGVMATHGTGSDGVATLKSNREASPDLYLSDIDKMITKIRPNHVPLDTISRYVKQVRSNSIEYKYYSLATKPIRTTLKTAIAKQIGGSLVTLQANSRIFDVDDTILVVGVKGFVNGDENVRSANDLMLIVGGVDSSNNLTVFATNGLKNTDDGQNTFLPAIPAETMLVRMGKACTELSAQTSKFANVPTPDAMYCQNFMTQVEEGTFESMYKKEVHFSFSDMEEDNLFAMKQGQELSFLLGDQSRLTHPVKSGELVWSTGGVWWAAGKDIEIGHIDPITKKVDISEDDLVDFSKEVASGVGVGGVKKVLLSGSTLLASLGKIKSDRFIPRDSVEHFNLKFKSYETNFGDLLAMSYTLLDELGMSDCGLLIDPEYMSKVSFLTLTENALELKDAGIRNSKAKVLQEVSGLMLRSKNAHARVRLPKVQE